MTETVPERTPKATETDTSRSALRTIRDRATPPPGSWFPDMEPRVSRDLDSSVTEDDGPGWPRRGRWQTLPVALADDPARQALLRRGFALEYATLGWNVAGIVVLAIAAISARSVALAGFGLDSLIEIAASTVVIWELSGTGEHRQRRALRLIGYAFAALAAYLLVQSTVVLATGYHPRHSLLGIIWTAVTAAAMFAPGRRQGPDRPGAG